MKANHAILVRSSGGVLFVPRSHDDDVIRLEAMAAQINGAEVHSIPLPADSKQAAMVTGALVESVVGEVNKLMSEVQGMLAGTVEKPRKPATLMTEHDRLKTKLNVYRETLNNNLSTVVAQLELFDMTMSRFMQQAA
jgi:hypothetical protein